MASSAAIVIAALVVVLFKFKSIVATVVVVAFVVAFDEPMMPFGSFVATLLQRRRSMEVRRVGSSNTVAYVSK